MARLAYRSPGSRSARISANRSAQPRKPPPGAGSFSPSVKLSPSAANDLTAGIPAPVIAARFHHGVAALIEAGCLLLRERHGLDTVALSGGVFQNLLLLERVVSRLEERGFRVLTHSRVPCNDVHFSLHDALPIYRKSVV